MRGATAALLLLLGYVVGARGEALWYGAGPALLALGVVTPWSRLRLPRRLGTAARAMVLGGVMAAVLVTASASGSTLSPLFGNTLSAAGFTPSGLHPQAIAVGGIAMTALVAGSLFGAMALVVAFACQPGLLRLPVSMRLLLASLGMLVVTLGYESVDGPFNGLYDRYLIPVLPGALAVCVLAVKDRRLAAPLLVVGVLVFAGWSVSWQREYMQRQAAIWQVAQALVDQGAPPAMVGSGFEWNGTYRGEMVIPRARDEALQAGDPRGFVQRVIDGIYRPCPWSVDLAPPSTACPDQPAVRIAYGDGWPVYGSRRCFPVGSRQSAVWSSGFGVQRSGTSTPNSERSTQN